MRSDIKELAENTFGRVEISDRKEFERYTIRPSQEAVEKIERLEELTVTAEQRLGNFLVGRRGR